MPNLVAIQTESYEQFLQSAIAVDKRADRGLEGVLRESFPIESHDSSMRLEYLYYDLGKPRYSADECRKLRLTYGMPFRIWVRLHKANGEVIKEEVYLGEVPVMMGGGEFIINGAERVIVSQLHRSPGVDFLVEVAAGGRKLHSCRIIPERGSWIEMDVTKKDALAVRIDQSGKFAITMFLRAMDEKYGTDAAILRAFYETEKVAVSSAKLKGCVPVEDVVHPETGEVLVGPRDDKDPELDAEKIRVLTEAGVKEVEVIRDLKDRLVLDTLRQDNSVSHEDALKRIFQRLRPGNPANPEKAQQLFHDKFFDSDRYRLGMVGRFRLNRKFGQDVPESEMTLKPDDIVHAIQYVLKLRANDGAVDDIDHLGNRRLRTIEELASDELRKGFLKLRHTVRERMSLKEPDEMSPRSLINSKTISSAIDFFFGRSELSQVVDQTNPLSQLSHERRLSALGPGGLNRKRASFEVRDVHISHYGRICPIETPEGTNIGLISNLSVFATVDKYGFLITPYRALKGGKVPGEIKFVRADEEEGRWIAPADVPLDGQKVVGDQVLARLDGEFVLTEPTTLEYMDVSPKQMLGVSAALIPFLEHNDANRALMGSNMQRQAVPLLTTEPPLVATGVERAVAVHSGMVIRTKAAGKVTAADADHIVVNDEDSYELRKFVGLNERTCLTQKPLVKPGDVVKAGDVIADGAGTFDGELALGRNVVVAFMIWDGYNFEDAIIISERLVKKDTYTSIHIEEFEVEIRETKLGREEFTRDIPNVSERQLRNLDEEGIIRIGTHVKPGDILVGKVSPKSKSELSPEEKLLHAIFGRAGEDVKNESLEVPPGVEGVVIEAHRFSRKAYMSEDKRKALDKAVARIEKDSNAQIAELFKQLVDELENVLGGKLKTQSGEAIAIKRDTTDVDVCRMEEIFDIDAIDFGGAAKQRKAVQVFEGYEDRIDEVKDEKDRQINHLKRGDELPSGVLEMVKIYVSTKRKLAVGDKMAGRHGNKGVIAKILPEEDMPYLADGTPVDIILNPLGVPSRMNVGQILETHLGWAARALGFQAVTPPFDGCSEEEIRGLLKTTGMPEDGKVILYDGRTGERFEQEVTVGVIYMMKLHHLVDDKVHARATGPYSLITQQPLGGKARMGGQRFGEMEVWALEAYGAAYILQELLTAKSDDVEGRTKIYEAMVKGTNTLEAGTPVSFDVLCNEIRGLGLNMQLEKKTVLD